MPSLPPYNTVPSEVSCSLEFPAWQRLSKTIKGEESGSMDERRQHILAHPEMAAMEVAIELVLHSPEVVRRSNTDNAVFLLPLP